MNSSKALYRVIAKRLIRGGVITHKESDVVCRRGHRKERYWKRHLLDLCEYSIEKMDRNSSGNDSLRKLCATGKRIAMNET